LLFSRDHARDRAKEAVGRRRHRGRRNASKKREWKRPYNIWRTCHLGPQDAGTPLTASGVLVISVERVTLPSIIRDQRCLTSVIKWLPVYFQRDKTPFRVIGFYDWQI
jgi:hypothetical protein